jgi:hypothetical protein
MEKLSLAGVSKKHEKVSFWRNSTTNSGFGGVLGNMLAFIAAVEGNIFYQLANKKKITDPAVNKKTSRHL